MKNLNDVLSILLDIKALADKGELLLNTNRLERLLNEAIEKTKKAIDEKEV
jgi:hypothetical protein